MRWILNATLVSLLESVEQLIKSGYQPERTVYLAFGHDEEIGGQQGAACIADLLEKRGVKLAAVLDEGGAISVGAIPGISLPVALLGIAEKGHATLELLVEGRAGHSSMPPRHTAIGVLARALAQIEANPMPTHLTFANRMLGSLGAFMPMSMRLAFSNRWLFGGTIRKQLEAQPTTNALIRTTTAITMIDGGVKDNILPARARAFVNFRLLPGDRVADLMAHVRKVVNDDAVQLSLPEGGHWEASPVSPVDSTAYQTLTTTIRQVFPDVLTAPYLVTGATDSRYFTSLTSSVYRFSPYLLNSELLQTLHGSGERISLDALASMVQFFMLLIPAWSSS